MVVKYDPANHDLKSFYSRFKECDANGKAKPKPIKKPVQKFKKEE